MQLEGGSVMVWVRISMEIKIGALCLTGLPDTPKPMIRDIVAPYIVVHAPFNGEIFLHYHKNARSHVRENLAATEINVWDRQLEWYKLGRAIIPSWSTMKEDRGNGICHSVLKVLEAKINTQHLNFWILECKLVTVGSTHNDIFLLYNVLLYFKH